MLPKDFENFEARLKTLREESREDFDIAEKYFDERYGEQLKKIFPRDILWVKKYIGGFFILSHADEMQQWSIPDSHEIFKKSVKKAISIVPLSAERKEKLYGHIIHYEDISETREQYFSRSDDISRDPFYALIEDFSLDGEISKEEFLLLQESFWKEKNFLRALETLPENIKRLFLSHISLTLENNPEKKSAFESEYGSELSQLEQKWINITPVVQFVARSYYKTPGKYRKYEHPKRRLRRTFKLALLRLLRIKLWNIAAEKILERFENGEVFEDYFMLLHKLLEVIDENPSSEEIYQALWVEEDIQDEVITAEENKEKIMKWDFLIVKIASLFSKTDSKSEEQELEDWILEKILDDSTDIVGEEIYFNREDENAGIYAEPQNNDSDGEDEEDELENTSPEVAYEMLRHRFHKIEEEKREAFKLWNYDDIDEYNEQLLGIESKLGKLSKILWIEV